MRGSGTPALGAAAVPLAAGIDGDVRADAGVRTATADLVGAGASSATIKETPPNPIPSATAPQTRSALTGMPRCPSGLG